jgi:purine-binding chemotaxis protein CheW
MFDLIEDAIELVPEHSRLGLRRLIAFTLADRLYALPITDVAEIRGMLPITPLPPQHLPPWVLGLINLRGMVLPVIDTRQRINSKAASMAQSNEGQLVIARTLNYSVALRVDFVKGLLRLDPAAFKPMPHSSDEPEFVTQVAAIDGQLLMELDTKKMLQSLSPGSSN